MIVLEQSHIQFFVPIPCFGLHHVDLLTQDLPGSIDSTNAIDFQFVLDLKSLLTSHELLYLKEKLIVAIVNSQHVSSTEFMLFTNVIVVSLTCYGIYAKTF